MEDAAAAAYASHPVVAPQSWSTEYSGHAVATHHASGASAPGAGSPHARAQSKMQGRQLQAAKAGGAAQAAVAQGMGLHDAVAEPKVSE